ncbi:uncharacterized protein LOC112601885 [Melanaphis sacchari]|uniref:uncharacterized protein LOC112601885 n=1 Tax=Melanaphis sacchari TaxID=742174 RepID=UPI000DC149DA|nr:uncharacterized protein LOC112601885 [Melanaphis sacchari]
MSVLSLSDVFKYAHCTPDTRNFVEGEQVLLAKHVILCGKIEKDDGIISIKSLIIQSSHIRDMPHEITGKLHYENNKLHIIQFVCTCKAGASESCKHIVAVLLHLNR